LTGSGWVGVEVEVGDDGWVAEVAGPLGCELDRLPTLLGVAPQAARTVARSTVPAAPDSASILLVGMRFLYSKKRNYGRRNDTVVLLND
jgi:hypothetical protein